MSTSYDFLDPSIDRRLAADIDAAEADPLTAYLDTEGNWTCGRGHLLPPAAPGRTWAGFTVVQSTADRWFNDDLTHAVNLAKKWPEYAQCDTLARQNGLIEIAFNMGGRWQTFVHARAAIAAQEWQHAHDQLLDSLWAQQVKGRAVRIANQFLTGQYDQAGA